MSSVFALDSSWALSRSSGSTAAARRNRYVSIGIEGTFEPVSRRDTLGVTGHFRHRQWRADLALASTLGVQEFRYPIPWHWIERERGRYDWRRIDPILRAADEEFRLGVIADTLHHTSYPAWLQGGFADPAFMLAYVDFVQAFAERYPEVRTFTPFNEPTCTLDFCGYRGFWHPYETGDRSYATMLRQTARASAEVIRRLRRLHRDTYILHVDTFEHHAALDRASVPRARFLNERRFLFDELLAGQVHSRHPLHRYLSEAGFGRVDLEWHLEHPVRFDERGGNYYPLNEEELVEGQTRYAPSLHPRGLCEVARDYAARLSTPLSLTETNIQGTARDRISWLKYVLEQTERLQLSGVNFRRFAWYPLFDCAGWGSLLQERRWARDPQGVFSCGPGWERIGTEFSDVYRAVAEGLSSAEIPPYAFTARHEHTLRALRQQMQWEWVPQDGVAPAEACA